MSEPPTSSSIDSLPPHFASSFLGKPDFECHSDYDAQSRPVVNATATGDARMIVGNVNTTTTITGEVKNVKVYQFPEVQVAYSSRIARDGDTIRRWLTSTDQETIYQDILARREHGTNSWLLENEEFKRWADSWDANEESDTDATEDTYEKDSTLSTGDSNEKDSSDQMVDNGRIDQKEAALKTPQFLWIHGGVGCGKSVLCSSVVKELSDKINWNVYICYFFFSFRGTERSDLSALLRSLLSQLSSHQPVSIPVTELYMRCHQTFPARSPSLVELRDVIQRVLEDHFENGTRRIYLVIDALDEVAWGAHRENLLHFLQQLSLNAHERLRILVSSRNESDIRDAFTQPITHWKDIPIEPHHVDKDIEKYINNGIEKFPSLKRQDLATKTLIQEKLVQKAHGMFRWSALQLSSLKKLRSSSKAAIRKVLEEIPRDLNETYERILADIDEYSVNSAIRALKWLVVSKRTLYIEELADACSEDIQDIDQSPHEFRETALEPFNLVEILRDLIEVHPALPDNAPPEPRHHQISLSHFSVQEFLLNKYIETSLASNFAFKLHEAHFSVARDCLVYLYRFNTPPRRLDSVKGRMSDFALREYAWYNWEEHVLPSGTSESVSDPARRKASILYINFKSRSIWTDKEQSLELTSWLPSNSKDRLLRSLNMPYFYPNLGGYFETPLGPRDDPRWFGSDIPDAKNKEIALISILPCIDPEDDIRCQLHVVNLNSKPEFKAISYALGPPVDSPIYIGGSKKSVRPQLASIFRNLRLHQEGQQPRFWVDAISLEEWQSNSSLKEVERREQIYYTETRLLVTLSEIFKRAQEVVISLGQETREDEKAITLMYNLVRLTKLAIDSEQDDEYIRDSQLYQEVARLEENEGWKVLTSLLNRTWWQRRWTIQEIVLARSAVMFVGNIAFSFDLIDRLVEAEDLIRKCLLDLYGPLGQGYHEVFDSTSWESIKHLSQSRGDHDSNFSIELATLLWRFRLHTAMYREDALRTILPLTWQDGWRYDEWQPVEDSYIDRFIMDLPEAIAGAFKELLGSQKSRCLDVLSLQSVYSLIPENGDKLNEPQSWFPALERDPSEIQPFIICSKRSRRLYKACGKHKPSHRFMDEYMMDEMGFHEFPQNSDLHLMPWRLSAKGVAFSKIKRISDAYLGGIRDIAILAFARDLAVTAGVWMKEWQQEQSDPSRTVNEENIEEETRSHSQSSEAVWRTLFADQYHSETRLPSQLPHSDLPSSLPPQNDADVEDLLSYPATQKALRYLYGRRFFLTENGSIGLAPFGAEEGDTIVVLNGGRVPYVIRETGKRLVGYFVNTALWNFIGECYVHGVMDGELMSPQTDGELKIQFEAFILEGELRKIPDSERPSWREDHD